MIPYRDVLERLWILDELPAWDFVGSELGRIARSAKHHLADPTLAVSLLGITLADLERGAAVPAAVYPGTDSLLGRLLESLATLSVRVYAQHAQAETHHFRNQSGTREIDLIVTSAVGRILAVEVKLSRPVEN